MTTSKKLNKSDNSGDFLTKQLFGVDSGLTLSFDRIQYDYKNKRYIIFDHILINSDIKSINDLSKESQLQIKKLNKFKNILKNRTSQPVDLFVSFFFPVEQNQDKVFLFNGENIKKYSLPSFSFNFKHLNFLGNKDNSNMTFLDEKENSDIINERREDNSSFSFTKAILNNDYTYGFNLDNVVFRGDGFDIYEYLLCEESQKVNPYTSHPNKYFYKNSQKFISLFELSKESKSNLYLINYAKTGTIHSEKVLFMKLLNINKDSKKAVVTDDRKTTLDKLKTAIKKRYGIENIKNPIKIRSYK